MNASIGTAEVSMNPSPSEVISIVVKTAGYDQSVSIKYEFAKEKNTTHFVVKSISRIPDVEQDNEPH